MTLNKLHSPLSSMLIFNFIIQKDAIIFALYSSNWMDMNMESRKLIVCAMNLNNANQLKLKFTDTKIVNLEMFSSVRILQTN